MLIAGCGAVAPSPPGTRAGAPSVSTAALVRPLLFPRSLLHASEQRGIRCSPTWASGSGTGRAGRSARRGDHPRARPHARSRGDRDRVRRRGAARDRGHGPPRRALRPPRLDDVDGHRPRADSGDAPPAPRACGSTQVPRSRLPPRGTRPRRERAAAGYRFVVSVTPNGLCEDLGVTPSAGPPARASTGRLGPRSSESARSRGRCGSGGPACSGPPPASATA